MNPSAPNPTPPRPKWLEDLGRDANVVPICVWLMLFVFAAFYPALRNGFVHYDDNVYVTANPYVQGGLTWECVKWAFRSTDADNWHPLTWLSHALDFQIFGLHAWGHHLTNILLHALNTALLFRVLRRMTGATGRSIMVAVLFGLHPLRVESVAWVAERKDVLSAFFGLFTLLAYAKYVRESKVQSPRSKVAYALALLWFALGLMAKPMLVTLPCVLLLLDYWPLERFASKGLVRLAVEKIPFLLLSAASSVVTYLVQKHGGVVAVVLSRRMRVENALVSYWRYLGKIFFPTKLSPYYPYPEGWAMQLVVMSGLLLLTVSIAAIAWRRRSPWFAVGWFWFVGTLTPVIGLVQVGVQSMADRYSYIPSIGIFIIVAWGAYELTRRWREQAVVLPVSCAAVALVCLGLTHRQIGYWQNDEALFRHALDVTKENWVAEGNLGAALLQQGRFDEAAGHLAEAIRIYPAGGDAHGNLAIALKATGHLDEAITEYQTAIRFAPRDAVAHNNLGVALQTKGQTDEAINQFKLAVYLKPGIPEAHCHLGDALALKGRLDEAIAQYQAALQLRPDYELARTGLEAARQQKSSPPQ